ncbi:MAG: DUF4249 domain-containing protein [Chitinophagaceae bacterium]|nr:MAG: DUF4249 domain-containing protein [Chitinophagaceae bacterium]
MFNILLQCKYNSLNLIFLAINLLFFSCTKEVTIDLPQFEPKLVVDCLFGHDDTLRLNLSKTKGILDFNEKKAIENALVIISEEGNNPDTLYHAGDGKYISKLIAKLTQSYTLDVSAPGFPTVNANDIMVHASPNMGNVSYIENIYVDEEAGYIVSQARIEILDDGTGKNYYELILRNRHLIPARNTDELRISNVIYLQSIDPVLSNESDIEYHPESLIFSNELFKGHSYILTVNYVTQPQYIHNNDLLEYDHDLIIILRKTSKAYYQFKKHLTRHLYHQESDFWSGVGEPVPMFSNIKGGYGIFAAYSGITDTIINSVR